MPGCHAEQLEFLVYGLRFARFYFRTISLPYFSNGNQCLSEPWRHARVHAIRCIGENAPPPPLHNNGVCHRARDIRKPWIISTCISLKHYVRPPLLAKIVIYLLSTAATASISVIYAPVICIHCSPTYGDGRG